MNNKNLVITLIVILSIFIIILTGGLILLLTNGNQLNFKFNFKSNTKLLDKYENNYKEVSKIYLNLYSTDIEIKESKNEKILVEYYGNKDKKVKIEYENNTIKVDEDNYDISCIGFCNYNKKVVVYVPNNYTGEYEFKLKSGDIKSDIDLSNNKLNIEAVSGDIALSKVGSSKITTTSGDIEIIELYKNTTIKTTSGDIKMDKLDINNNSFITTVSGDIEIDNNISNCYIDTDTISGDQKIKNSNRKSDIVLKVKTVSGDINVY